MGFEFRLQKVLEDRNAKKTQAQEELAQRQCKQEAVRQELAQLKGREEQLLEMKREFQQHKMDVFGLLALERYQLLLQDSHQHKQVELSKCQEKVSQQREEVVERWRNCQVLEKVKEKAFYSYMHDEKIREQRLNDEITLYSYMRNNSQHTGHGSKLK